jgi:hypothetical protein
VLRRLVPIRDVLSWVVLVYQVYLFDAAVVLGVRLDIR